MAVRVFIDGQAGTTGLRIQQRLSGRTDLELMQIDPDKRKDPQQRKQCINESDVTILCLPDDAAREAVSLVENPAVKLIDASTAHRTNPDWAYGFPELSKAHREAIQTAKRVAVPGCYASGFASLVYPMVQSGLLPADYPVSCFAVSGYSGGGKKMIAELQAENRAPELYSPRFYGLGNTHKHLPEMQKISGLLRRPMFTPIVDDFFSGMMVCVPVQTCLAPKIRSRRQVYEMFEQHYAGAAFVSVTPYLEAQELSPLKLSTNDLRGTNQMELFICGDDQQLLLCSRLDNLGKGASGAAVQCLNLMFDLGETKGLEKREELL